MDSDLQKTDVPVTEQVFIGGVTLSGKFEIPPGTLTPNIRVIEYNGQLWIRQFTFAMSDPRAWLAVREDSILRLEEA